MTRRAAVARSRHPGGSSAAAAPRWPGPAAARRQSPHNQPQRAAAETHGKTAVAGITAAGITAAVRPPPAPPHAARAISTDNWGASITGDYLPYFASTDGNTYYSGGANIWFSFLEGTLKTTVGSDVGAIAGSIPDWGIGTMWGVGSGVKVEYTGIENLYVGAAAGGAVADGATRTTRFSGNAGGAVAGGVTYLVPDLLQVNLAGKFDLDLDASEAFHNYKNRYELGLYLYAVKNLTFNATFALYNDGTWYDHSADKLNKEAEFWTGANRFTMFQQIAYDTGKGVSFGLDLGEFNVGIPGFTQGSELFAWTWADSKVTAGTEAVVFWPWLSYSIGPVSMSASATVKFWPAVTLGEAQGVKLPWDLDVPWFIGLTSFKPVGASFVINERVTFTTGLYIYDLITPVYDELDPETGAVTFKGMGEWPWVNARLEIPFMFSVSY